MKKKKKRKEKFIKYKNKDERTASRDYNRRLLKQLPSVDLSVKPLDKLKYFSVIALEENKKFLWYS